ncbi:MAG: D-glycero-beta-D-manno-heptose-7-phosphate kinase [Thermodesulfobacteriota bacterium]|nr:D-glycero-beta-D-manno-heptose-7-phosphate kinase [Thermodesulfobacteriota bacterium]
MRTVFEKDPSALLPGLEGKKVLVIGDLMLDHYVTGQVERISPEAPVPVVLVENERFILGGAGNVAKNIKGLGGAPLLVGVCGDDHDGEQLKALLHEEGIPSEMVVDPDRPTTKKIRIIARNQQVVRVDREAPDPIQGKPLDAVFGHIRESLAGVGVIIISDYGKGLVTAKFMERLRETLKGIKPRPKIFVDPKTRNFSLYKNVDLLTPNAKEAGGGVSMPVDGRMAVIRAGLAVFKKLRCKQLLITLGPEGMAFFQSPGKVWHVPTAAQKVFDVTGAGDTVIATIGLAAAAGLDMLSACALANHAAGTVVGEVGTVAVTRDRLEAALREYPDQAMETWLNQEG